MGSSSSRRRGSTARARARATRWAWPPDRRPGFTEACSATPIRSSHPRRLTSGLGLGGSAAPHAEGHVGLGAEVGEEQIVLEDHPATASLGGDQHTGTGVVEDGAVELDPS